MTASNPSRGGAEEMEESLMTFPFAFALSANATAEGIYKGAEPPLYAFSLVRFFDARQRNEQQTNYSQKVLFAQTKSTPITQFSYKNHGKNQEKSALFTVC